MTGWTGDRGGADGGIEGLPANDDAAFRDYSPERAGLDDAAEAARLCRLEELFGRGFWSGRGAVCRQKFVKSSRKAVGKNNEPLKRYIVNLVSGDNRFFLADTTDTEGRFLFPLSDFDDGTKFNMKVTDLSGKGCEGKLIMDKIDYPRLPTPRELKRGFSSEEIAIIRRQSDGGMLDQAELKDTALLKPVVVEGVKSCRIMMRPNGQVHFPISSGRTS